jgi:hypothetical protein
MAKSFKIQHQWLASQAGTNAERRAVAERLFGDIEWFDDEGGYITCPGIDGHTANNGRRDCRVFIDQCPNVRCFHQSCRDACDLATSRLHEELAKLWTGSEPPPPPTKEQMAAIKRINDRRAQEDALRKRAADFWDTLQKEFGWDAKDSPTVVSDDPAQHWRQLIGLFQPGDIIWIGDRNDSAGPADSDSWKGACKKHFRPAHDWLQLPGEAQFNFTCASTFQPGSFSRSNVNVAMRRFLILEHDDATHEQVLAVYKWCTRFMRLRAIVNTAGKSLHAWFGYPSEEVAAELKVILSVWGFDTKMFTASQPCRLAGSRRADKDGAWQRLIWLDSSNGTFVPSFSSPAAALVPMAQDGGRYWSASEIYEQTFEPITWVIEPVLPDRGTTVVAGPPKLGKSYLTLSITFAAAGGPSLGTNPSEKKHEILVLALEDTARRIQKRMKQMLSDARPPEGITFRTASDGWPKLDEGGLEKLVGYLDKHPATSIVVVDTWQKVKGSPIRGKNAYESDYDLVAPLHKLAAERDILLILVHHTKKAAADDVLDELSGSRGLTGVADTILVLKRSRGEADATLFVTGRDVDEVKYALRFKDNGTWTFQGLADEVNTNKVYSLITTVVANSKYKMVDIIEMVTAIDDTIPKNTIKSYVYRMKEKGLLFHDRDTGLYCLPPKFKERTSESASDVTSASGATTATVQPSGSTTSNQLQVALGCNEGATTEGVTTQLDKPSGCTVAHTEREPQQQTLIPEDVP